MQRATENYKTTKFHQAHRRSLNSRSKITTTQISRKERKRDRRQVFPATGGRLKMELRGVTNERATLRHGLTIQYPTWMATIMGSPSPSALLCSEISYVRRRSVIPSSLFCLFAWNEFFYPGEWDAEGPGRKICEWRPSGGFEFKEAKCHWVWWVSSCS